MKKIEYSRRGFLTTAATVAASAGLAGISPQLATAQTEEKKEKSKEEIIYRTLGRTGMKLPIVSMGAMNANNPEIVSAAYDLGVRHFDTAAIYQYGRNEQMLGRVIKKLGVRDKVNIATKVFHGQHRRSFNQSNIKQGLFDAFDASLKRLQMDYVDILYIHSVNANELEEINDSALIEGLNELKKQGKVKAIGISTHRNMAVVINNVTEKGIYDVILTSINVGLANDTELLTAIKNASDKGVGIVAMKTQAGGSQLPNTQSLTDFSSEVVNVASLKWVMNHDFVHTSIPGFANYEHMKQDVSVAYDLEYTDDEKKLLGTNDIELGMGYCHQCEKCLATCPKDADIPTLMRTHMYAAQYGNLRHARLTLDEIPKANGLSQCVDCSNCVAECVNTVDIPFNIDDLKSIYV